MKQLRFVVLMAVALILPITASAQSETLNEVRISATVRSYVLRAPRANAELVRAIEENVAESAVGRDEAGEWLRIHDGWVLTEVFNTEGEIGALPDATASFLAETKVSASFYDGPSARWFDNLGAIAEGASLLIIGRSQNGDWLKTPAGWIEAAAVATDGDMSRLPVISAPGVVITAKARTFILAEPDLSAEFVDVFEAGAEALAIGRAGDWLQIQDGWVSAAAVEVMGDPAQLPYAGDDVRFVKTAGSTFVRSKPGLEHNLTGTTVKFGEELVAIGRNHSGSWLQLEEGWIGVGSKQRYIESDGDIMSLPITDGTVAESSSSRSTSPAARATPTPRPALDARDIRSLVARQTDNIRILDIDISGSVTSIKYDLKPWPFVPNESIANEVAFKIICAIRNRQPLANTLEFIGHTHFKSDVGRKFTGPSVEMRISANNANRIVCLGNDPSDINWRRIASSYRSHRIPAGASIDYGS